ncbi:uncharacterized protein LOC119725171 [Patiria miniata]|uniref:G-protein coupled receptors family 2 profile 2 domain-containing protein n=1 Tax=Patiria miniata TaxID=46514 RepID=A0A913ZMX6_PATMI|nr:uncharacterized protein LOC119725171 [Patiria miniata]
MHSRISRMLVLLGVAGTLLGGALAQEDVEERLWDAGKVCLIRGQIDDASYFFKIDVKFSFNICLKMKFGNDSNCIGCFRISHILKSLYHEYEDLYARPECGDNFTNALNCDVYEQKVGSCSVERLCACDELCERFGDCCRDNFLDHVIEDDANPPQSTMGNDSSSTFLHVYNEPTYQVCVGLPSSLTNPKFFKISFIDDDEYDLPQGYLMVGKCPPSWNDADVRHLCEAPEDESDLLLLLPVVSSDDAMTSFRNIYCAICHGVPLATVTSWRIEFTVPLDPSFRNANYIGLDEIVNILNSSKIFNESNIRFKHKLHTLRSCVPNLIDDCPSDYDDERVIRACRSYLTPVVHPVSNVAYRNWHCAFCNNATHPTICQMERFSMTPQGIGGPGPLTALVDFKGNRLSLGSTGIENTCGKDEFLDPFTLRCRALFCPQGFALVNGVCLGQNPPADVTGIIQSECIEPGYVDMEVDMCLGGNSSLDPCELWRDCLSLPYPPVVSGEWCRTQGLVSEERSCTRRERVHLTVNSTVQELDDILSGDTERPYQMCPFMASVTKVVLKKGCIPSSRTTCKVYQTGNVSGVYLTSWNKSKALYLLDLNTINSLQESLYQISYTLRNDSVSNITHIVTMCGDPVDFNCPLVKVNSTMLSQLLNDTEEPLTDTNHAILDTGGALVCRHLVFTPPVPALQVNFVVTTTGFLISMLALVASFVTYVEFPSLRNLPGQCVMSLIVAVFSTQLLLLMTDDDMARSVSEAACTTLAILVHYVCLSTFSWTNALAFYLSRTLGPGAKPAAASQLRHSFLYFSLFGWGGPLIIVFICVILHLVSMETIYGVSEANGGIRSCSITDTIVEIVGFVVPICVSLVANAVLFVKILMGFTFRRAPSANVCSKEGRSSRKRRDAFISVKIGFLLAFTWIFGFLATAFESIVLLYIFCIMTSLQGVYIFLAFTFTQQVRALWREKLGLRRQDSKPKKTTQRKYFKNPRKVTSPTTDKKGLCRQHSPSEHQTADTAHTGSAKDVDIV